MLDTPVVIVDLPAVEQHVARLQGSCNRHGLERTATRSASQAARPAGGIASLDGLHDEVAVTTGDGTAAMRAVQASGRTA